MSLDDATLRAGLPITLERTDYDLGVERVEGKVRDTYVLDDGTRHLVTTDRISAFDRVLGTLPFKGQILNQLSAWWMSQTRELVPNHLVAVPDPAVSTVRSCEPLPIEFVMRAYITGVTSTSVWTHYDGGAREFCGHRLPDGLKKNEPLPEAILTPSTKAEKGGHDESVSRATLLERGVVDEATFDEAAAMAHRLFAKGREICRFKGLILVDTKYEIGRAPEGSLMVIDEIHTPDSSRYWRLETYEARMSAGEEPDSFDKEYVRRWLAAEGFKGDGPIPPIPDDVRVEASRRYIEACETIRGEPFEANLEPPIERIAKNLGVPS